MDVIFGIFNAIFAWIAQLLFGAPKLVATYDSQGNLLLDTADRGNKPVAFVCFGSADPATVPIEQKQVYLQGFTRPIDTARFQYVFVTFTEMLTNMQPGHDAGKAELVKQIGLLNLGQKFVICGGSEGAAVCSDVYDELRTGTLQSRRGDFLGGFMCGNPRRPTGVTFPGYPDPAPGTSGAADVRLFSPESLWWEMAVADDPVTCVSDTSNLGVWIRRLYNEVHKSGGTTVPAIVALVGADPDGQAALALFSDLTKTGHVHYIDRSPFSGDPRSFMQVGIDYVNSLPARVAA